MQTYIHIYTCVVSGLINEYKQVSIYTFIWSPELTQIYIYIYIYIYMQMYVYIYVYTQVLLYNNVCIIDHNVCIIDNNVCMDEQALCISLMCNFCTIYIYIYIYKSRSYPRIMMIIQRKSHIWCICIHNYTHHG